MEDLQERLNEWNDDIDELAEIIDKILSVEEDTKGLAEYVANAMNYKVQLAIDVVQRELGNK
jgi:hypothetical protein